MSLFVRGEGSGGRRRGRQAAFDLAPHSSPVTRHRLTSGFTLIEVLVVLVIIGIVVALIGVNFAPDSRQTLDTEAQRLALLLQQARDEAMASGSSVAFSAEKQRYRFWQRKTEPGPPNADPWKEHEDKELFRPRLLPDPVTVAELRVNQMVTEKESQKIIFTPSGAMLPFSLILASGSHQIIIKGNGMGQIEVARGPS